MDVEQAEAWADELTLYIELGYDINRVCPHCGVYLKITDTGGRICLNACDMPTWMYREMNQGLAEAARRVAREAQEDNDGI